MRDYLLKALPEIEEIKDETVRNAVIDIWCEAMQQGKWEDLKVIPFTLLIPDLDTSIVEHTRRVTRMAMAVGSVRGDVNMDTLIAGALLHDVGKLLEYEKRGGKVVKSDLGRRIRHPVYGAAMALAKGLPDVAHIIIAHSKEGEYVHRTPEAVIVYHCDFIDFEVEKSKRGMK